jgi:enoyl-CoA hydratase
MSFDYSSYDGLDIAFIEDSILQISLRPCGPSADRCSADIQHADLARVWPIVDQDRDVRVVLAAPAPPSEASDLTKYGPATYEFGLRIMNDGWQNRMRCMQDASDLVHNLLDFKKPIVALWPGAFTPVVLLADVSIAVRDAVWADEHVGIGIAAGDHAVLAWPLHIGMAKAKYYLLTSETFTGEEAERMGLVSLAVDADELRPRGIEVARKLASGSQRAIRLTKKALNHHYRNVAAAFDASLAYEFLLLGGDNPDAQEGFAAAVAGRAPEYPERFTY